MSEGEAVRPRNGSILDLWDNMMRPFDEAEEASGDNQDQGVDVREEGRKEEIDDGGEDDEAIGVEEEEGAEVKIGRMERAPSKEEVAMHMVNHIPFRSWCSHCIKGKSGGNQHRRRKRDKEEAKVPVVSIDYIFMHDNQAEGE